LNDVYFLDVNIFKGFIFGLGGKMLDLSKYWTWNELCNRWGIPNFEVFDYLQKGLIIYSKLVTLESCPGAYHRYNILQKEQNNILSRFQIDKFLSDGSGKKILPNHTKEDLEKAESKALEFVSKEQKKEFLKIKNEMSAIDKDDPDHFLWKYFEMPESYGERRDLFNKYKDCLFKRDEVIKFEKKHELGKTKKKGKKRPDQEARDECREIAKKLRTKYPDMPIFQMKNHPEIMEVGKEWMPSTRHRWICDLFPAHLRRPGRKREILIK
jgi:hypothetical protein